MRKEIQKVGTGNCYGYAGGRVGVKANEEHDTFARVMKKDGPGDEVRINGMVAYDIKHKP